MLIYSCGVRDGGAGHRQTDRRLGHRLQLGGLGADHHEVGAPHRTEKKVTRCCIVDAKGNILADSLERHLADSIDVRAFEPVFTQKKAFFVADYQGKECCVAHARAPGFETYSTGWFSLIIQPTNA